MPLSLACHAYNETDSAADTEPDYAPEQVNAFSVGTVSTTAHPRSS
jgi:hypothetical protein